MTQFEDALKRLPRQEMDAAYEEMVREGQCFIRYGSDGTVIHVPIEEVLKNYKLESDK